MEGIHEKKTKTQCLYKLYKLTILYDYKTIELMISIIV